MRADAMQAVAEHPGVKHAKREQAGVKHAKGSGAEQAGAEHPDASPSSPARNANGGDPTAAPVTRNQAVNRGNAVRPAYSAASPSSSSILRS